MFFFRPLNFASNRIRLRNDSSAIKLKLIEMSKVKIKRAHIHRIETKYRDSTLIAIEMCGPTRGDSTRIKKQSKKLMETMVIPFQEVQTQQSIYIRKRSLIKNLFSDHFGTVQSDQTHFYPRPKTINETTMFAVIHLFSLSLSPCSSKQDFSLLLRIVFSIMFFRLFKYNFPFLIPA